VTIISEAIADIAGAAEDQPISFRILRLRENHANTGITTVETHSFKPVGGVLTTSDLDPGPAQVRIGATWYDIEIPVAFTTIKLWPLIDAGVPAPDPDAEGFVRNAGGTPGGVARIKTMYESEYSALTSYDPATEYHVFPNP